MNYKKIIKFLLFFCIATTMTFVLSLETFASDYKYKVLDPKYNSSAQDLIDGKLSTPTDEYIADTTSKQFDFIALFAAAVLVTLPIGIFAVAIKALKQVSNTSESGVQTIGNITISKKDNADDEDSLQNKCDNDDNDNASKNSSNLQVQEYESVKQNIESVSVLEQEKIKPIKTVTSPQQKDIKKFNKPIDESVKKYFTSPVSKIPNPMLLNTSPLAKNKGFCVVEYNKKYSLIGYINNEIFMLDQFDNLKNYEIRSRLTESKNSTDRYIVRLGEYKALVEVGESNMSLLLEL